MTVSPPPITCWGISESVQYLVISTTDAANRISNWNVDTKNPSKVLKVETVDLKEEEIRQLLHNTGFTAEASHQFRVHEINIQLIALTCDIDKVDLRYKVWLSDPPGHSGNITGSHKNDKLFTPHR